MNLDDLDKEIAKEDAVDAEEVFVDTVAADDAIVTLSVAVSLLSDVGELLEEILDHPLGKRRLTDRLRIDCERASDEIYDFLQGTEQLAEEWMV